MTSVGALIQVGLIETIRARGGRLPWLDRHLERLHSSIAALGLTPPVADVRDLLALAVGPGDGVIRLELRDGHADITIRGIHDERSLSVVVSDEVHQPYAHKTTQRDQFGRALVSARRSGANDAVLLTAAGLIAEGTAWNLFWWDGTTLCTPAADLGILQGVGRRRVMELTAVREEQVPSAALRGCSLFLVNSVRGIVEFDAFAGTPVPRDPRTTELAAGFWPD